MTIIIFLTHKCSLVTLKMDSIECKEYFHKASMVGVGEKSYQKRTDE